MSLGKESKCGPVRRIVLTGFMGSGKSTVGPMVAERLGWAFVDADDVIVAETGMAIADFFARHGEAAFRERERETIARLVHEDGLVLALGGGAIEDAGTRELLLAGVGNLLVHLEVSLETARMRCGGTEHTRPVLADEARLAARYTKRLPLYREAHSTVVVDELTPEQVADAVHRAAAGNGLQFAGTPGLTRAMLHIRKPGWPLRSD
ncbi:MAG TPA: shikimate kinase [Terracidiphilus sp.]|jgi:shikimate kinase|nr:shikimate kinase [Terracidiphilus sp.]